MKFTGSQTMVEKGPTPFGEGDPHRAKEIAAYKQRAAEKALQIIDNTQPTPAQPVAERPPVDLSQLPPPDPLDRKQD